MDQLASWVATGTTILAACLTASNLGSRITGYGFVIFTIGSIGWFLTGLLTGQPALMWTNVVMTLLNLFGVYRWLGRQAKVEDGAARATEKSATLPGEDLFAASALASAKLLGRAGEELGACVDAMIGCGSGRLHYLVVAEGGVAGVGETFRRVDWRQARMHEGAMTVPLDRGGLEALPTLTKNDWPGR
ncbi:MULTISPECIES: PRC-barrel domain-containing protein [Sphingomonas]|uniref:PRC-barrel domain-containing protein n=1 Tax=Sphingomonas TaxID=13687 RepID=UPI000DEF165C|nr:MULTISPECIES: PRC-barrel domain-containing protein [Sphingomonas]